MDTERTVLFDRESKSRKLAEIAGIELAEILGPVTAH